MSNKTNSATITPVLAAGSADSPYFILVNITQRLCSKTCASRPPVFSPRFSLAGFSQVGTGQYVATVHVEGVICYSPCETGGCCDRTQNVSQDFTVPFASATAPSSVSVEQGASVNAMAAADCQKCSRTFVSETPLTLTVA